jgi:CopG family transcriptional regulator, nickel-responsive regulator
VRGRSAFTAHDAPERSDMSTVDRFGVSMDPELLRAFDRLIERKGYRSRSEAIRDIVRNALVEEEWRSGAEFVVGTVTLVYDHDSHELAHALMDLQHRHHEAIACTTHIHLDEHNCLEVVVVRGPAREVREIGDRLISTRGVKHGRLSCSTTGRELR